MGGPNPFRFLRDNSNGTADWAGPGGNVVTIDYTRPSMQDYAPPQQAAPQAPAQPAQQVLNDYDRTNAIQAQLEARAPQAPAGYGVAAPQAPAIPAAGLATPPAGAVQTSNVVRDTTDPAARQAHVVGPGGVGWQQRAPGTAGAASGAVPAPVVTAPGAPRRTSMQVSGLSQTVQTGAQLPDGLIQGVQSGSDQAASAALHTGKNEAAELAANEQMLADRNRIVGGLGGLMDQSVAAEQGRGDRLNQAQLNFDDIANRARSMTVDPDRRSGGDRITGAIASLLGGIGSGITGGPNHAVQIIQHAIDRDVEAQRSNVANAQHGAETARTAYQLARDQGASEREAEAVHMGFEYRRAADEMERLAALTGSQEAMDAATITAEQLRATGAALVGNLSNLASDRTSTTTQQRPVTTGGGGGTRVLVQQVDAQGNYIPGSPLIPLNSLPSAIQGHLRENNLAIVSGVGGGNANAPLSSSDQTASRDYASRMASFDSAERELDRIEQTIRQGVVGTGAVGGLLLPNRTVPVAAEQAREAQESVYNLANRAMNGTRATDQDRQNIARDFGPLVGRGEGITMANIQRARERLRAERERVAAGVNDAVVQHNEARVGNAAPPAIPSSFRPL